MFRLISGIVLLLVGVEAVLLNYNKLYSIISIVSSCIGLILDGIQGLSKSGKFGDRINIFSKIVPALIMISFAFSFLILFFTFINAHQKSEGQEEQTSSVYVIDDMDRDQTLDMLDTDEANPIPAIADSPSNSPGPHDLDGQDGVASPTNGWLADYVIKRVKGTTSGNAYLRWSPSNEGREYKRYVCEDEIVTVLATENGYSLVKTSDGRAGWVTSKLLK